MRQLIEENAAGKKMDSSEILNAINTFSESKTRDTHDHWFMVEMKNINNENTDLLNANMIRQYLSFVAPVPYSNKFIYRNKIHDHAKELNFAIDEYSIKLNGEDIYKEYKTQFRTKDNVDEIFEVRFKDFYDDQDTLIAWLWFGVSKFVGAITSDCQMRGLRLRTKNIQIGDSDALQRFFKESRGNHYFVGEVHSVSNSLTPNARRDYFKENPICKVFEHQLRSYCDETLYKIYHGGSDISSAVKKVTRANTLESDYKEKIQNKLFINKKQKEKALEDLNNAKDAAEKATSKLSKIKERQEGKEEYEILKKIAERQIKNLHQTNTSKNTVKDTELTTGQKGKAEFRTDSLTSLSRKERKMISKVFDIIAESLDKESAEIVIEKIIDALK